MANSKSNANSSRPGGRPTCYREAYTEQAYKLTLLGATDADLADFFGVCERTINNWKGQFPEFLQSLKRGKLFADADVAASLHHRAIGYSHPEEKIFLHEGKVVRAQTTRHYPPDTGAAMAWLKNRQGLYWRDNHDVNLTGQISFGPVQIECVEGTKVTDKPRVTPDEIQADSETEPGV